MSLGPGSDTGFDQSMGEGDAGGDQPGGDFDPEMNCANGLDGTSADDNTNAGGPPFDGDFNPEGQMANNLSFGGSGPPPGGGVAEKSGSGGGISTESEDAEEMWKKYR